MVALFIKLNINHCARENSSKSLVENVELPFNMYIVDDVAEVQVSVAAGYTSSYNCSSAELFILRDSS
ncbi:hypothetical protein D9M71_462030 [compost metagenome]